jgi:hypothetical protein
MATYGIMGIGSSCYVYSYGIGDFALKNLTFEDTDVGSARLPISRCTDAGLKWYSNILFRRSQRP